MFYTYQLNETIFKDKDGMIYTIYGIDAIDRNGNVLKSFKKIFFQRSKAIDLIALCNDGELSLTHLANVVEDALYEQSIKCRKLCC